MRIRRASAILDGKDYEIELSKIEFRFSDSSIRRFVELTDASLPADVFEKVISQLEKEASNYYFNNESEANLLRIFNSIYDKSFFFRELPRFPHHAEILVAIAGSSNYLTDIVVRHPEFLYQLFDNEFLSTPLDYFNLLKELSDGVNRYNSFNSKLNHLRQFKQRFILKIGTNDILHFEELIDTTKQLSILAKIINDILFKICYEEILLRNNIYSPKNKYAICSLGKLGGGELNYSSDVDLILFYDFNSVLPNSKKDFHEILSETIQLFSKSSTELTSNGYIYRVDFRLRPDGKYSPLCKELDDYIKYYETRGEDWERQMLIKLDFVGGSQDLYNKFISFVIPYVYKNNYSSSIKDKIRTMKSNIERHHNNKDDVKTFIGGIRDIEFTVQALQLLNGGSYKELRTGNSLTALDNLLKYKLISKNEFDLFCSAYIVYRRIEHFLQLMNDQQTHVITENNELIEKLSVYLQNDSVKTFKDVLEKHRKNVRKIYDKILETGSTEIGQKEIKFTEKSKAMKNLQFLRSGQGIIERKEFDSRTIELFNSIEPVLTKFLLRSPVPDRVLENFVKVIRGSRFISIWYGEFTNSKFFESFLTICQNSQKSIDLLVDSNALSDYFLSRKAFIKKLETEFEELSINHLLFALSLQFPLHLIDTERVSKLLTDYVTFSISKILEEMKLPYKFFIAGMGSYGASNMSFSSDVDLVVVAEDVNVDDKIQSHFQQFLFKVQNKLKPLEVDFRLRPEGKKSQLVWDLENYSKYLRQRARVWEFQSLSKLRFAYGDEKLFSQFKAIIYNQVKKLDEKNIISEIKLMHINYLKQNVAVSPNAINVKKQRGGATTLDFVIQYLILANSNVLKKINNFTYQKVYNLLKKVIAAEDVDLFSRNQKELKRVNFSIQCLFNSSGSGFPQQEERKTFLVYYLNKKSEPELEKEIRSIFKTNIQLFEKYIGV